MVNVLRENNGELTFSSEVEEYILDRNMQLKAIKLKNGQVVDSERLHRHYSPKHPLLRTPIGLQKTLDQFFVHEFREKRLAITV
jgi:hypothetical protein